GFLGAAWGVGFGVEIKDEVATLEILQRDRRSAVALQRERRRLRAYGKFARHMPSFRRFRPVNGGIASCVGWAQAVPRLLATDCAGPNPGRRQNIRNTSDEGRPLGHDTEQTRS